MNIRLGRGRVLVEGRWVTGGGDAWWGTAEA